MVCYGRKKLLLVASFLSFSIISSPELFPQSERSTEEDEGTGSWLNGRVWEGLDLQAQVMYLTGVEAGLNLLLLEYQTLSSDVNELGNLYAELTVKGFKFSELAEEVSAFYGERTNIRIPIVYAYVYVIKKAHGADPAELGKYASDLRKKYNQ